MKDRENLDQDTVDSFGVEWQSFDQVDVPEEEIRKIYNDYFAIFPWESIDSASIGFDMGCGSGRWAKLVAPKVGVLHCIDPSEAIFVAQRNLSAHKNVYFHHASVDSEVLESNSQLAHGLARTPALRRH